MKSDPRTLSVRLDPGLGELLEARARQSGEEKSTLARRYLHEGARMDAHPGIVFRPGPAGRRAAVAGGPDVWEVIRVVRNVDAPKKRVSVTADWLSLSEAQVRAAVDYYAAFPDEIDDWIARVDEAAAREQEREERRREALA